MESCCSIDSNEYGSAASSEAINEGLIILPKQKDKVPCPLQLQSPSKRRGKKSKRQQVEEFNGGDRALSHQIVCLPKQDDRLSARPQKDLEDADYYQTPAFKQKRTWEYESDSSSLCWESPSTIERNLPGRLRYESLEDDIDLPLPAVFESSTVDAVFICSTPPPHTSNGISRRSLTHTTMMLLQENRDQPLPRSTSTVQTDPLEMTFTQMSCELDDILIEQCLSGDDEMMQHGFHHPDASLLRPPREQKDEHDAVFPYLHEINPPRRSPSPKLSLIA